LKYPKKLNRHSGEMNGSLHDFAKWLWRASKYLSR